MKIKKIATQTSIFGFFLFLILTGCSGDGEGLDENGNPMSDQPVGFAAQIQPIFNTNCIRCHQSGGIGFNATGGSQNNGLDLTQNHSHAKLVNQHTFEAPDTSPRWRVLPGEPDSSYIVQKISSSSPKFGNRMPLDGPPYLSQDEINLIRQWIENGALNN